MASRVNCLLAQALALFVLAGIATPLNAQGLTCQTCQGASQYYPSRPYLADECCPECKQRGNCCCPQCFSAPPLKMPRQNVVLAQAFDGMSSAQINPPVSLNRPLNDDLPRAESVPLIEPVPSYDSPPIVDSTPIADRTSNEDKDTIIPPAPSLAEQPMFPPQPPLSIDDPNQIRKMPNASSQPGTSSESGTLSDTTNSIRSGGGKMRAFRHLASSTINAGIVESTSSAPNMIGDFFSNGITADLPTIGVGDFFSGVDEQTGTNIPIAAGDRRIKFADGGNPLPTNRVFFNYNHFSNAISDDQGRDVDVDRFVFGLERTFLHGNASIELRVPFAVGLDARQFETDYESNTGTEFGNLQLNLKGLLLENACRTMAVSAGLGMVFPTAKDAEFYDSNDPWSPTNLRYLFQNDAFHLMPFFAIHKKRGQSSWMTFTSQLDFATSANEVLEFNNAGNIVDDGELLDQDFMYLDLQLGHHLYRCPDRSRHLQNVAAIVELHYNTTISDADSPLFFGPDSFSSTTGSFDAFNLTGALRFQCANNLDATLFAVAPLSDPDAVIFDAEFGVQINRHF